MKNLEENWVFLFLFFLFVGLKACYCIPVLKKIECKNKSLCEYCNPEELAINLLKNFKFKSDTTSDSN